MTEGPVRRSQMIAPFGTGALVVARNGVSLISGGLDHWFKREDGTGNVDLEEYMVHEWRLEKLLQVDHFRLPADFRRGYKGQDIPNAWLTQPFLRFPRWHFCPSCNRLHERPLTERGRIWCPACNRKNRKRPLFQVPFVAMCEKGHIQDFPWREWVHRSEITSCQRDLRLIATGGASLAAQHVKCDCGAKRTLARITEADPDGFTFLSKNLLQDQDECESRPFLCRGLRPWLGEQEPSDCDRHLRGSLRSASNLYFAVVSSSIYLPRSSDFVPSSLISLMEEPPLSTLINLLSGVTTDIQPQLLRQPQELLLEPFSDEQIHSALQIVQKGESLSEAASTEPIGNEDKDIAFRRDEFNVLRVPRKDDQLFTIQANMEHYEEIVRSHFSNVILIHKLRETRAFAGFTRVYPHDGTGLEDRKKLLRKELLKGNRDWLPAYVVFGEGIFVELDESRLRQWENRTNVSKRARRLDGQYQHVRQARRLRDRLIDQRFVLLHTLSHLLMNRLTFECGYSSAALRERLYYSSHPDHPMAGILIYTAAGDAEGTMGGLVRMGKPGNLEPVLRRALESANWCSADPVCAEAGEVGGQGPDSLNLAACHNCTLVPETACEEFNRILDRGMVIGTPGDTDIGFFELQQVK